MTKYNIWFFSSIIIASIVALPIITVFLSFFSETSNYFIILKNKKINLKLYSSKFINIEIAGVSVCVPKREIDLESFSIYWDKKDLKQIMHSTGITHIRKADIS